MLLTNTISAETVNTTIASGNAIVNVAALRGCSVSPAGFADRPTEKPSSKRPGVREMRDRSRSGMHAVYSDEAHRWQTSSELQQPGCGTFSGFGRSIS